MFEQAGPEFYTDDYYRTQCGGHELFDSFDGRQLEPIRRKAVELAQPGLGQVILDVGCGRGEIVLACALRGAQAIGIDFSPNAVQLAQRLLDKFTGGDNAAVIQMDAADLGFRFNQFDSILMLDFVEHIPQDRLKQIIARCHAMLKPGGRLIVHTGPTQEFIRYGQHAKRLLYRMLRQPVPAVITWEGEARLAGHCNLHSKESLWEAMTVFEQKSVDYHFSIEHGRLKQLVRTCGLTRYLAFNLWGIGVKTQT
jgi:ubiquinone/menaquinone biosynthesis C-methylase UbiE